MKKFLLLGAAVLIAVSASAQLKRTSAVNQSMTSPKLQLVKVDQSDYSKAVKVTEPNFNGVMNKAPKKQSILDVWYTRPAGVFPVGPVVDDGEYAGKYQTTFYL